MKCVVSRDFSLSFGISVLRLGLVRKLMSRIEETRKEGREGGRMYSPKILFTLYRRKKLFEDEPSSPDVNRVINSMLDSLRSE